MKEINIKGSNDCIAIDVKPSEECKKYHENSYIQINVGKKNILKSDKDSVHYFMCHMTQQEYEERYNNAEKNGKIDKNYKLNKINNGNSTTSPTIQ